MNCMLNSERTDPTKIEVIVHLLCASETVHRILVLCYVQVEVAVLIGQFILSSHIAQTLNFTQRTGIQTRGTEGEIDA